VQRPDSLPAQLFLLAVDPRRQRLTGRGELGHVLRAAALVDLQLGGQLLDVDGRPKAMDPEPVPDPVLAAVLSQVAADPGRRWRYWIRKDARRITRQVADGLVAARRIEVHQYRILGVMPAQRIVVLDPLVRDRIVGAIDAALSDAWPVGDRTAALVSLAAAAQLRIVLPRSRRRAHRHRIAQLTARTGPVPPALRRVLGDRRAAAGGG
jgi:Golgi phosphoprotein 3 (GPP34)